MVADEAHALKNRASARTRKLRKAATACEHRILLTGERKGRRCGGVERAGKCGKKETRCRLLLLWCVAGVQKTRIYAVQSCHCMQATYPAHR